MGIVLAITPWPAISALLWFILAVAVLYFARHTAHQAIHTTAVALNVTKLRPDNFDPKEYLARVDAWKTKVEQGGGRWRMINDLERASKDSCERSCVSTFS